MTVESRTRLQTLLPLSDQSTAQPTLEASPTTTATLVSVRVAKASIIDFRQGQLLSFGDYITPQIFRITNGAIRKCLVELADVSWNSELRIRQFTNGTSRHQSSYLYLIWIMSAPCGKKQQHIRISVWVERYSWTTNKTGELPKILQSGQAESPCINPWPVPSSYSRGCHAVSSYPEKGSLRFALTFSGSVDAWTPLTRHFLTSF